MRLSTFGKALGAIAVFGLASGTIFVSRDLLAPLFVRDVTADRRELGGTTRTLVYRVPNEGVLRFNFSRPAELVKIISQPNIAPEAWGERGNWIYGFRVLLFDESDVEIARYNVFSRSLHPRRLRPFKRPVRFRRDSDEQIGLQDEAVIVSPVPAVRMELTALTSDPAVRSIDARIYERLPFIGDTAQSAFLRRSVEDQGSLARADAFPPELLNDAERSALMVNRWKVIGPSGISGRDYQVSVFYERPYQVSGQEK